MEFHENEVVVTTTTTTTTAFVHTFSQMGFDRSLFWMDDNCRTGSYMWEGRNPETSQVTQIRNLVSELREMNDADDGSSMYHATSE
jgi:hypothetical protein